MPQGWRWLWELRPRLDGGDGVDTVVYTGKLADYQILLGNDGHVRIADKGNGDVDIQAVKGTRDTKQRHG
ncbi:hypothetical protein GTP38_01290 [Duganella sp. FT94W]|uniref:Haemolysin-type calcium binding-related domain-containing protein n=1 Tax=Duganella lactea TaxID=2692173 RepID=A0ABW9V0E9_9BURK|nr:hypothetical protein [Duganella lactea]MYM32983.1 hypothetical protein [Duganella lactea]